MWIRAAHAERTEDMGRRPIKYKQVAVRIQLHLANRIPFSGLAGGVTSCLWLRDSLVTDLGATSRETGRTGLVDERFK